MKPSQQQNGMRLIGTICVVWLATATTTGRAELAVAVSPLKITGRKAVVPLAMKNNFTETVESARAVCFLLDEQGKIVGQASRWVIGGTKDQPALEPGKEAAFNFVVSSEKIITATNLTAKVSVNRLVLDGGQLVDPAKNVVIKTSKKD